MSHAGDFCCHFLPHAPMLPFVYFTLRCALQMDMALPCLILLQVVCDLQGWWSQGAAGRSHSLVHRNSGCTPFGAHQPLCPVRISCLCKFLSTSVLGFNDSLCYAVFHETMLTVLSQYHELNAGAHDLIQQAMYLSFIFPCCLQHVHFWRHVCSGGVGRRLGPIFRYQCHGETHSRVSNCYLCLDLLAWQLCSSVLSTSS